MASKKYACVEGRRCAACGACVKECPGDAVKIQSGCLAVIDYDRCVGCGICARICPAGCIELVEREVPHA